HAPGPRRCDIGVGDHSAARLGPAGTRTGCAEHQARHQNCEGEHSPMSSGGRLDEERLQEEIRELRGDLGETVETLVHKADLPTRAKAQGAEFTERALDYGIELHQQALERGRALGEQAKEWGDQVKTHAAGWSSRLRGQAATVSARTRDVANQTP